MAHSAAGPTPRPPQRRTRRERRREETRERIFRAALRLFAQRGFLQTTVEEITEAADVGKGTFFNYFPTKEHVLSSFGDERLAVLRRAAEKSKHGPALEAVRDALVDLAQYSAETPALMRAICAAHASNELVRAKLQVRLTEARRIFAQMFALAQKRGEVRRDISPGLLGRLVHLLFFGVTWAWCMNPDFALKASATEVWDLIQPGLKAKLPRGSLRGKG